MNPQYEMLLLQFSSKLLELHIEKNGLSSTPNTLAVAAVEQAVALFSAVKEKCNENPKE